MNNYIREKTIVILGGVMAFMIPLIPFMALCGFMILVDMITGVKAAKKKGLEITSRRRKDTVTKGIVYMSALIISHSCVLLFKIPVPMLEITGGYIVYTELTSIDENYFTLTGKKLFYHLKKVLNTNSNPEEKK